METFKSDSYEDGRTKQAFKDDTDINKILDRAAKGSTISHLAKHGAVYGDFSDIGDLLQSQERLQRGIAIFQELPGEVRKEFNNSAGEFFEFVNNPANTERLSEVLPALSKQGKQMPVIRPTPDAQATPRVNPETPAEPPQAQPEVPPGPPA